jgi:hypothetical protein
MEADQGATGVAETYLEADGEFHLGPFVAGSVELWVGDDSLLVRAGTENVIMTLAPRRTIRVHVDGAGSDTLVHTKTSRGDEYSLELDEHGEAEVHLRGGRLEVFAQDLELGASPTVIIDRMSADPTYLRLSQTRVRGRLVGANGAPIRNAEVQLNGQGLRIAGWTDDRGQFTVQGVTNGRYQVSATPQLSFATRTLVDVGDGDLDLGDLQVATERRIRGRFTDTTGLPVADATVAIEDRARRVHTTTESDGTFVFDHVVGTVDVCANFTGEGSQCVTSFEPSSSADEWIELTRPAAARSCNVKGHLTRNGVALANAQVTCHRDSNSTDEAGVFEITCPVDASQLEIRIGREVVLAPVSLGSDDRFYLDIAL